MLITIFTFANKVHIITVISKSDLPVPLFAASLAQVIPPVKPFGRIFLQKPKKGMSYKCAHARGRIFGILKENAL